MKKLLVVLLLLCGTGAVLAVDQPNSLGYTNAEFGQVRFVVTPMAVTFSTNEITAAGITSYVTLNSTGADMIMTGRPTISTATTVGGTTSIADGSYMIIGSTMVALRKFVLQDNSTLSGTLLMLPGATEVITSSRTATFIYSAPQTRWIQVSPNNGSF